MQFFSGGRDELEWLETKHFENLRLLIEIPGNEEEGWVEFYHMRDWDKEDL